MNQDKLILVYNAHSGIFSAASDFVKKLAQPEQYDCQLCMVTYGAIKMQHPWKEYLASLPFEKKFMYRDQLTKEFPDLTVPLPTILLQCGDGTPSELLSATEINQTKNLQDLIVALSQKLAEEGRPCGHAPGL